MLLVNYFQQGVPLLSRGPRRLSAETERREPCTEVGNRQSSPSLSGKREPRVLVRTQCCKGHAWATGALGLEKHVGPGLRLCHPCLLSVSPQGSSLWNLGFCPQVLLSFSCLPLHRGVTAHCSHAPCLQLYCLWSPGLDSGPSWNVSGESHWLARRGFTQLGPNSAYQRRRKSGIWE